MSKYKDEEGLKRRDERTRSEEKKEGKEKGKGK